MTVMHAPDLQEVQTLPRGHREVSSIWYAQHRLAYSTMASHSWTCTHRQWFFHLGRAMETSCMYALSIVQDIFEHINWRELKIETVVVWTDGPRQFRNRRWLGTLGFLELRHRGLKKVCVEFGCPKHFKSTCDGKFASGLFLQVHTQGREKRHIVCKAAYGPPRHRHHDCPPSSGSRFSRVFERFQENLRWGDNDN